MDIKTTSSALRSLLGRSVFSLLAATEAGDAMTTNPKWFTTALDDRWSWDQSQRLGKPAALFCISKHPDRAEVFYDGNTARIVSQQYCQSDGHYKCKIVSSDGMGGCDPDAQEWEKEEVPETELMPNERQATPPTATPSISNSASAPSSKRKRGSDSSDDSSNGSSDDSSEDEDEDDDDDEEEEGGRGGGKPRLARRLRSRARSSAV